MKSLTRMISGGIFTQLCWLFSLFVGLRIAGSIDWAWYWIAAPLLAPVLVAALLFTALIVATGSIRHAVKATKRAWIRDGVKGSGPRCLAASRGFANEIEELAIRVDDLLVSTRAATCATPTVLGHLNAAADSLDDAARRMSAVADDLDE